MMRYLPFMLLSLVLYTLFFYYHKQPDPLVSSPINNQQVMLDDRLAVNILQQETAQSAGLATLDALEEVVQPMHITTSTSQAVMTQQALNEEVVTVSLPASETQRLLTQSLPTNELESSAAQATANTEALVTQTEEASLSTLDLLEAPSSAAITTEVATILPAPIDSMVTITSTGVATSAPISDTEVKTAAVNTSKQEATIETSIPLFPTSEESEQAIDSATLKAEFFDNTFKGHIAPKTPPKSAKKKPKKVTKLVKIKPKAAVTQKQVTQKQVALDKGSLSAALLKENKISVSQQSKAAAVEPSKAKRSFKKQAKTLNAPVVPGLQNAIAVSGRTPAYPPQAHGEKGSVTAKFTVSMQGKAKNAQISVSSGHKVLDDALLKFISQERFMPALEGTEKVTSEQQLPFEYRP